MRSYSQKKKNNIVIGSLCAVMLLMVVGYAAFNSVLDIKGTSKISSNWNIHFDTTRTTETNGVVVGSAGLTGGQKPTGTVTYEGNLTANVTANLIQPGDTVEYHLVVVNDGTIDAKLDKITPTDLTEQKGSVIFTRSEELNVGDVIKAGETKPITVTIKYDSSVTSQLEKETVEFTLSLDFVQTDEQGGDAEVIPGYTGTVYSYNLLKHSDYGSDEAAMQDMINIGDSLEKIIGYTEDYNTLGSNFFLKHIMNNEQVTSSEVCFIKDNHVHCLKQNEYETSKEILLSVFKRSECSVDDSLVSCDDGSVNARANNEGVVSVIDDVSGCTVYGSGLYGPGLSRCVLFE